VQHDTRSPVPYLYIDENVTVHEGEEAARLLREHAAEVAVDPRNGVARVDDARWREAQRYERRTWMQRGLRAASDRNEHHRDRFEGYTALRGLRFRRGIELGCGPFTNLRLILETCRIDEVVLLDPLIEDYLRHPFCRYRGGRLGGLLREHPARLPSYALHPLRALRSKANEFRVGGWLGRPVTPVAAMIETFEADAPFDVVVMINVLEHCRDAHAVFARIDAMLAPGGIFLYHDKMYDAAGVRELLAVLYDAGHPLRVDHSVVDSFLEPRFEPLLRREHPVVEEFRGVRLDHRELYFIGRKRT
jgi:SAM-dependent methyltransferase